MNAPTLDIFGDTSHEESDADLIARALTATGAKSLAALGVRAGVARTLLSEARTGKKALTGASRRLLSEAINAAPGADFRPVEASADLADAIAAPDAGEAVSEVEAGAEGDQERKADTARFLMLLDEEAEVFCFQTFDDLESRKLKTLARTKHGTIDDLWPWLDTMNQHGAGVFVNVNETDGRARKIGNIIRPRAVFADFDPPKTASAPLTYPLPPAWQVESSPGKRHAYWPVDGLALDDFKPLMQTIVAALGSDPAPCDLPRVMRLPGFYHLKNPAAPHLVRLVEVDARLPYRPEQITAAFGQQQRTTPAPPPPPPQVAVSPPAFAPVDLNGMGLSKHALHVIHSGDASSYDGGDRSKALYGVCKDLIKIGLQDDAIARILCDPANGISQKALRAHGGDLAQAMKWTLEYTVAKARAAVAEDAARPPLVDFSALLTGAAGDTDTAAADADDPDELTIEQAQKLKRKMMRDFSALHAVTMIQGRAVIVYREVDADTGRHVTRFSGVGDISLKFKPLKMPIVVEKGGLKVIQWVPLFPSWLESKYRTTYQQLTFQPSGGLIAGPITLPKTRALNLYQGLALTPVRGTCERIKEHIQGVWCANDPTAYNYVMDWLARMFQVPQERGHTVIALRSGEGTGKNIIIDILVQALGEHALVAVKADGLVGRFNDDLATSVLVFANEAVWGGDKALEGALKSLITDEELPVERKYIPKFRVRNCVHLMMASNSDWIAPIGLDDRRFVVLDVSEAKKGDAAYFAALHTEIANGGREAFVYELLHRDIAGFNPRILPELAGAQATKFDAKIRGADSVTQWWSDCLYAGEITATVEEEVSTAYGPRLTKCLRDLSNGWDAEIPIPCAALYDAYQQWASKARRHIEAQTSFGKKMLSLGKITKARIGNDKDGRTRCYMVPALDASRTTLDAIMKQRGPWHDGEAK